MATSTFPVGSFIGYPFFLQLFVARLTVLMKGQPELFDIPFTFSWIMASRTLLNRVPFIPYILFLFVDVMTFPAGDFIILCMNGMLKGHRTLSVRSIHILIKFHKIRDFLRDKTACVKKE
jgi:hypothetical protein